MRKILLLSGMASLLAASPLAAESLDPSEVSTEEAQPEIKLGYQKLPEGVKSRVRASRLAKRKVKGNAIGEVCRSVQSFPSKLIFKGKQQSKHLQGDVRKNGISVIALRRSGIRPGSSCITVYNSLGNIVTKMGSFSPPGPAYDFRFYTLWGCAKGQGVRSSVNAKANQGNGNLYFKIGSSCYQAAANSCVNSSSC